MTMLIEKYFFYINKSIMRQIAHLESTLKKKKNNCDEITELMKEIESIRQEEEKLESQVAQSVIDLESQIQANNVIISEIKL